MTARVRALFVDLDGTLADSIEAMYDVYADFLVAHDRTASRDEFDRLNGPSLREVVTALVRTHEISGDVQSLYNDYIAAVYGAYATAMQAGDGADALIDTAAEFGVALVLVTANHRRAAEAFLAAHGWRERFIALVTGDDVTIGKPDPALYRHALAVTCVDDPAHALAIEDSANGIASATGAGLPTIALCRGGDPIAVSPLVVATARNLHDAARILRETCRV
ncbi:MAG: HAD family phosphatase [Deltaproteobacteria bacterium]|nr:HAD family phosphatase [Deltaproteobacteria bacterium]